MSTGSMKSQVGRLGPYDELVTLYPNAFKALDMRHTPYRLGVVYDRTDLLLETRTIHLLPTLPLITSCERGASLGSIA